MPRLLITDANAEEQLQLQKSRNQHHQLYDWRGCVRRLSEFGCIPGVQPSNFRFQRIPRSEWKQRIAEGRGKWLGNLTRGVLPPHDQGATNYCWAHGSVRAVEALRVYECQSPLILSAESVAVPVTGGRNRGGSPDEALERLMAFGCCEQSYWPLNDLNERHAKPGWVANALEHAILRWLDVENFDDQMSLALHRIPVAIGLNWWGHLVCQLDPIDLDEEPTLDHVARPDGQFGIGFDNSWGDDYGDHGYAILDEKHATADLGAFAPISETFSARDD